MTVWLAIPLCYLLGSIPSAVWVSRIFSGLDIREHGSRNAGLTNVYRVLGWKPALPVALVDFAKGLGAVLLGAWWSRFEWGSTNETFALGCGLAAIVGHTFTVFAGFRGGKGVLTAMGVFVGIAPVPALVAFAVWLVVLRRSGFVSLASILAALALGLLNTSLVVIHLLGYAAATSVAGALSWSSVGLELVRHGDTNLFLLSWAVAIFVVWKHRPNIRRLRAGTEYRFGRNPEEDPEQVSTEGVAKFRARAVQAGLDPRTVAVVGAGSWGLAISQILSAKGLKVRLWEYSAKVAEELTRTRELPDKLPGVKLSESVEVTADLAHAVEGAAVVCLVVPSHTLRGVCTAMSKTLTPEQVASRQWVSFIKGVEEKTLKRMTEIVREVLPGASEDNVSVLSGPSHAEEVARQVPTTVVVASRDEETAAALQELFFLAPYFRTYRSTDVVGVELCGAVKNVIAIASGILDGLGLGDNTRGALMTRGMVEMARLGEKLGGKRDSFFGLAGMGDLITTCISRHSRNRFVGEQVGKGRPLQEVLSGMTMVAEGVRTVAGVRELARLHQVEMPLTEQVFLVLFEGKPAREGVEALMARAARAELG
ncbi:MAG TPA: glycerol-3-phosphate 1-O-acyltransferase PlsY [Fibrobacteria bacterium]|nr:glycerol-3-phosphate 1-O-acyltransferase PlsY [Fibrobacteria bacterium]